MAEDHIRYDILAQDALRGVVRKVLSEVARTGIPGEHHFFISFATRAPGVRISSRLLTQYPEEMTIVLQHQYWDLSVSEQAFEVGLSFNNVPERLLIPFTALKGFADPSVQFGLQFELAISAEAADTATADAATTTKPKPPVLVSTEPEPITESSQTSAPETNAPATSVPAVPAVAETATVETATVEPAPDGDSTDDETENAPVEAEIVSLDAFRKK